MIKVYAYLPYGSCYLAFKKKPTNYDIDCNGNLSLNGRLVAKLSNINDALKVYEKIMEAFDAGQQVIKVTGIVMQVMLNR